MSGDGAGLAHAMEEKDQGGRRALVAFAAVLIVILGGELGLWMLNRMRPGWGQRFTTTILVVDALDQSPVKSPGIGFPPTRETDPWEIAVSSRGRPDGAVIPTISWTYKGNSPQIEVSAPEYEPALIRLEPDSPREIKVELQRKDDIPGRQ